MSQEDETPDDKKKFSDRAKEKAVRVRQHLQDNKTIYIACGVTGIVCFVGGKYLRRPIVVDFKPVITNNNLPTFNNSNFVENNLGRVSKIVRNAVTGQEWQKIKYLAEEIAKEHGISIDVARVMLHRHFIGELSNVFGKTYEIVGLRTNF